MLYAGFTQPEISAIALSISIFKRWLLKLPFLNYLPILFADPVLALKPRFASLTSKPDPCLVSFAVVCSKIKGTDGESVLVVGVRAVVFASEVDSNPKGGGVLTMGASSADPKLPKQMARCGPFWRKWPGTQCLRGGSVLLGGVIYLRWLGSPRRQGLGSDDVPPGGVEFSFLCHKWLGWKTSKSVICVTLAFGL